jgi:hypothetical protein
MNQGSFVVVPGDVHCISFQSSTIAVIAAPRELHVVRDRQICAVFASATSDFVHVEMLDSTVLLCALADGRLLRLSVLGETKRQRDASIESVDDKSAMFVCETRIVRVQCVDATTWLLESERGATQYELRFRDPDRSSVLSCAPLTTARLALVRACNDVRLGVFESDRCRVKTADEQHVVLDLLGEPIVHFDVVCRRRGDVDAYSVIAVGAFGTIGVAEDISGQSRVWRQSVGISRCDAPCAVSDDGELLLVNDGERLLAVSLLRCFEETRQASVQTAAPVRALQRSVPVALALHRTPLVSDHFVAAALLANGAIVTLEREFLSQAAFSDARSTSHTSDHRSMQRALSELDAVAARENAWRKRDAELNDALRDMAVALRLAPALLDRSIVQCRLQASMGQFSVFDERALIGVHVTYTGAARLSQRWSLSVRSRVAEPAWLNGASVHAMDIPLHLLPPATASNATWTAVLGVPFDVSASLDVSVALVFAALEGDDGWTVPLIDEQRFDALDFCKLVPPRDEVALLHCCAVALHSDWHALLSNASADERAAQLLGLLVPAASKRASAHLLLANGDHVRLRVSQSDDFQLSVVAECASVHAMATVRACLLRRIAAIRRGTEHAAVAAKLHHYALAGGGKSAAESAIAVARVLKSCLDKASALQDEVDVLIASRRALLAADVDAPATIHLQKSVEEQIRLRDRIEQTAAQLRQTMNKTFGL